MNDSSLDKAINELYQKSKQQLDVPPINFSSSKVGVKRPYSLSKVVAIFSVSLTISVGVFAIIQHLANLPESIKNKTAETSGYTVELDKKPEINVLVVTKSKKIAPLPKNPILQLPTTPTKVETISVSEPKIVKFSPLPKTKFPAVTVSMLAVKPSFKVMPNIDEQLIPLIRNGFVQLRFSINKLGKTEHIKIVKSNVDRKIQRAAKKALIQWRYQPQQEYKNHNDVVFEFKQADKKNLK